jgi:SAM-dependent methyltransferase
MRAQAPRVDWHAWLRRWDRQQTRYIPHREERFEVMLDVVDASLPRRFRALDVGCGPGSLSQRLLSRFPQARSVAVDFDPVLLEIGRHALSQFRRRLTWVEADIRAGGWVSRLPPGGYDVALSTTALHWLRPVELRRAYRAIRQVLRPHGLFLNGDHMPAVSGPSRLARAAREAEALWLARTPQPKQAETWSTWWFRLEREPGLASFFEERERRDAASKRRRPSTGHHGHVTLLSQHLRFLRSAGFREAGVVWSEFGNRVVLAIA